jgi:hypothetical protein
VAFLAHHLKQRGVLNEKPLTKSRQISIGFKASYRNNVIHLYALSDKHTLAFAAFVEGFDSAPYVAFYRCFTKSHLKWLPPAAYVSKAGSDFPHMHTVRPVPLFRVLGTRATTGFFLFLIHNFVRLWYITTQL